jgi:hypothetical protein
MHGAWPKCVRRPQPKPVKRLAARATLRAACKYRLVRAGERTQVKVQQSLLVLHWTPKLATQELASCGLAVVESSIVDRSDPQWQVRFKSPPCKLRTLLLS